MHFIRNICIIVWAELENIHFYFFCLFVNNIFLFVRLVPIDTKVEIKKYIL